MGMTPFNSVAGFSVGKGTANVILANGDVVTNNITVSNKANLSAISNVIITGGSAGQFIQTDGSGNLTFATVNSSGLANGNSNVQVYSNGNVTVSVAGVSNVLVVSNTGANVTGYITADNANLGNAATANYFTGTLTTNAQPNITSVGTLTSLAVTGNVSAGNISATLISGTLETNAQPNITSVGTLTTLTVSGNANVGILNASQVIANIAQGTAPFVINSNTKVANLNADLLDGYDTATANTANTVAIRDVSGNLSANFFIGNGSQLSGLNTDRISNGTSNVSIPTVNGNINLVSAGNTTMVVTDTGANITGNANVSGNVSASYFSGNGSSLTGLTFNALTDAVTANVTIDEVVYQGTTRLIVGHTGASGYTFTQYTGLNPTLYAVSGTTLALDLTSVGHPLLIQYGNGTNCDIGLTHVSTTGVLSSGALAQAQVAGTLYWQIPIDLVGNFKYQCFNHVAMNGAITLQNGNFANAISAYTGNISAGNINVINRVTASNVTVNNTVTSNVLSLNNSGPQFGTNPGDLTWNNNSETYELLMNDGVQQSIGQEQYLLVKANTAISLGQVVSFAGVDAGRILGDPANAQASGFISSLVVGVAAQNIGVGNTGYITSFGQLDNVNTNSFNVGDILYLDPAVPGGFTNVLPNAPNAKVQMAAVLTKALTTGSLQVRVTGFPQLEQLRDVSTTVATNNQYLRYTTSGNYWIASNLAISNDPTPTLGANLNAANYSFANVNDITANTANFNGALYSNAVITAATQLATKAYVDNASSTGIHVHEPVLVEAPTALTTTYTQGGTTPTITTIATNNTLTTSSVHGLSVNDIIVFGSTTNGLTAGTAYFVYSTPATNQITLSLAYNGPQITTLVNGTGLTITSRANSGVGAKLTNAGAQAALILGGVTMALTNRVIVYNQTNAFENGVYTVTNIGSPSTNWELTRATDQNKYAPNEVDGMGGGDYFYIQSGTAAGESYVLSTAGVLIIGTTNLSYTLFSASLQYTGTSPVVVAGQTISLANLTGTGDFVVLANSPTLNTPNIGAATGTSLNVSTGNINAGNLILTGLANVTGNVTVGNLNAQSGNVNANVYLGNRVSVGGNIDGGNFNPSGNLVVSGNASAANISTAGTLSVTGNANVGNIGAARGVFTGNVTAGNANVTGQLISTVATGTAPFVVTSTTKVANLVVEIANTASFVNVATVSSNVSYPTFVYAGITGDYPLQSNTAFSANLANGAFISTTHVGNLVGTTANVTGQLISTIATGTAPFVVSSTTLVANLNANVLQGSAPSTANTASTIALRGVNGNLAANFFIGNGSQLTGIGSAGSLSNGTSNVSIPVINGNVNTSVGGTANVLVVTTTGANIAGTANISGNVNAGNLTVGTGTGGNITGANLVSANFFTGTLTTNAQPNITSVGTLTSLTVTGNASAGNVTAVGGIFSGNGNGLSSLTGANVTGTVANATFATTAGSATTADTVTTNAQPNITSVGTLNNLVVTVNANVGNLLTDNLKYANGTPYVFTSNAGGANTQIQFNDANAFAGSANLTFNKTTNTFTTYRVLAANIGNATSILAGDGGLISNISVAGGTSIVNGTSNVLVGFNGNITMSSAGNANVQVVTGTGVNVNGTLNVTGISTLGSNANVKITGGTLNQVLTTDGAGNLSWSTAGGSSNYNVLTVSANTTITSAATVYFANGPITLTLPTASTSTGASYYIKNINNQYVTVEGINTIDGYANMTLRYLNSAITVISDGSNWNIF